MRLTNWGIMRRILAAIERGEVTNFRPSENMFDCYGVEFDLPGDLSVELYQDDSVHISPAPQNIGPCIGLSWQARRVQRALHAQGFELPTDDTLRRWGAL